MQEEEEKEIEGWARRAGGSWEKEDGVCRRL